MIKNLIGNKYGKLTVVSLFNSGGRAGCHWVCVCDCGNETVVHSQSLRRGLTTSCGNCPNEYVYQGEYVAIKLSAEHVALIDSNDYDRVKAYRWWRDGRGYVCAHIDHKVNKLHRYLLDAEARFEVDHINLDPLDNRRSNLRLATRKQNSYNIGLNRNNTSGYKGVSFDRQTQSYRASIVHDGQRIWLGRHKSAEEAARVRDQAADTLQGDFAWLNFSVV